MRIRTSTAETLATGARSLITVIVGAAFLVGGSIGAARVLERADAGHVDHALIYLFSGMALFGALMLPGVFTIVKPILVFVFPNGLPLIGGRRKDDPPAA